MSATFAKAREQMRDSLWLWPGVSVAVAFAAAKGLVAADRALGGRGGARFLYSGGLESARELLSTVASSILTFTGLVFTITIVALQLASTQFSPRVLTTFLKDRETKLAMAVFVGTFVFALAVLQQVGTQEEGFVPGLSVYLAFALVLCSVGMFIHFIHHIAHAVRAVTIVRRVAAATRESIERLYPERVLASAEPPVSSPAGPPVVVIHHHGPGGVLVDVEEQELLAEAERLGAVVALVPQPGEFVPGGAPLFRLWGSCAEVDEARLREAVAVGPERTVYQDAAFGFRQLVDVAERALSPGVNDPSTAVLVLDHLHDLLRLLARRHFPSPLRADRDGRLRLVLPRPPWEDYVHLALDEIRNYGAGSLQVVRRLRALIDDLARVCPPERLAPLELQRRLLEDAARRQMPSRYERNLALP